MGSTPYPELPIPDAQRATGFMQPRNAGSRLADPADECFRVVGDGGHLSGELVATGIVGAHDCWGPVLVLIESPTGTTASSRP